MIKDILLSLYRTIFCFAKYVIGIPLMAVLIFAAMSLVLYLVEHYTVAFWGTIAVIIFIVIWICHYSDMQRSKNDK